jgi:hypothetical protein
MTDPVIVDAGPALNFFSINQERLLIDAVGKIAAPETVGGEIKGKARQDSRFRVAADVWAKLEQTVWLEVLSDAVTPELAAAVQRITQVPMAERMIRSKDLGEIMVLAHAAVRAESGSDVVVLIDDGRGADLAALEAVRFRRLQQLGRQVGNLSLMNTHVVLELAAGRQYLPDRKAMRQVYGRLRQCDESCECGCVGVVLVDGPGVGAGYQGLEVAGALGFLRGGYLLADQVVVGGAFY